MTIDEFIRTTKEVPLVKRAQKWWDMLCMLGGIAAAIIWFIYGGLREGFDWISSLLMIAIPFVLVWLRPVIDQWLLPFQPARQKIPRLVLIGIGIAVPFFTAWILYNIFHINQYPLMWTNLVIGTLAAYALTRDPKVEDQQRPDTRGKIQTIAMIAAAILLISMLVMPVAADDCARDPLNARDCLRTSGYAEAMAGLAATLLSGLVNGPIIIQGVVQGSSKDNGDDDDNDDDDDEEVTLRLTYPAGYSPRVFTRGWIFGASATAGDDDVSDKVRWSGSGEFVPDTGRVSRPSFSAPGPNQIVLTVPTEEGEVSKTFTVDAVSPASYAHVGSLAKCDADAHGCPACPHTVIGPIQTGSTLIMAGDASAARVGDTGVHSGCCGPNTFTIETGDASVLIEGRPAARIGDVTRHCGGMGKIIG